MSPLTDNYADYGSGRLSPSGALRDDLLKKLRRYKRSVAKRYRICLPENIDRFLPEGALHISTKIDGQLWFLVKDQGETALCSYNGRVMQGVPVCDEAEKALSNAPDLIIAGELWAIAPKGRPRVHHVNAALGQPDLSKTLAFKAFDLFEEDGEEMLMTPYEQRLQRIQELLEGGRRVSPVLTVVGTQDDVLGYYQEWVRSSKFEGIVVRSEQGITYKVKPTLSIDLVIVAYGEARDKGIEQIRELTVALLRDDGSLHIIGTVGNGFSDQDRISWHERLSAMQVPSSFRMANREGTLCRFVRPEIIVEIKCSDLMDTDSSDLPVRRMVVEYDPEEGYATLGAMPIPSMIAPIFLRERADKAFDIGSIGLDQVYSHMPFEARHDAPEVISLDDSAIVRRGVYAKTTKERTAVRKYVVVKTNKDRQDPRYAPYVVFFTDFSPARGEPLKTSLRVASTEEDVDAHIEQWVKANVKKGWKEHPADS